MRRVRPVRGVTIIFKRVRLLDSSVDCLGHFLAWHWEMAFGSGFLACITIATLAHKPTRNCSQPIPRYPHFLVPAFGTSSSLGNKFSLSFYQVLNSQSKMSLHALSSSRAGLFASLQALLPTIPRMSTAITIPTITHLNILHFSQTSGNQYFAPYLKRNRVIRGSVCGNWQEGPTGQQGSQQMSRVWRVKRKNVLCETCVESIKAMWRKGGEVKDVGTEITTGTP